MIFFSMSKFVTGTFAFFLIQYVFFDDKISIYNYIYISISIYIPL